MRTNVKTSFSNPGALVQRGNSALWVGTSRAVRMGASSGIQASPPPQPPRKRWASNRLAEKKASTINSSGRFMRLLPCLSVPSSQPKNNYRCEGQQLKNPAEKPMYLWSVGRTPCIYVYSSKTYHGFSIGYAT